MIYASCRSDIGGSVVFSSVKWSGDPVETLEGKRVVVLVHGVKNTMSQIEKAYAEIFTRGHVAYDAAVGFVWPGGVTPFGWPLVSAVAVGRSADRLSDVLNVVAYRGRPASIDIDAHSLGCKITMEALKRTRAVVDGVWLMAPAMDRSLARYEPEIRKLKAGAWVFHSRRDYVLTMLYQAYPLRWPPLAPALGAYGERTRPENLARTVDCTDEVGRNHTGYRRSNRVIQTRTDEANRRRR